MDELQVKILNKNQQRYCVTDLLDSGSAEWICEHVSEAIKLRQNRQSLFQQAIVYIKMATQPSYLRSGLGHKHGGIETCGSHRFNYQGELMISAGTEEKRISLSI